MKFIIVAVMTIFTVGCSTTSGYGEYIKAQSEANRQAVESQKPLVRLVAQPGQAITGLASLKVYMPTSAPIIQQQRPNEWVGVFGQGLNVVGTVMGIKYAGQAAVNLADSIGNSNTAGYKYVQAPGSSPTVNTTDSDNTSSSTSSTSSTTSNTTSTTSSIGDNSGSNSGNSGTIAGSSINTP